MGDTMRQQTSAVNGAAALESLLHALDPISLLLSHNSAPQSEPQYMERGPRYNAYAELRESKLRSKYLPVSPDQYQLEQERELKPTPVKKQVKFQVALPPSNNVPRKKGSAYSSVAQSVPDFSAVLRREKENRRPATTRLDLTPPLSTKSNYYGGVLSSSRGSKSASTAGEKKGLMSRKSYASLEELKGLSSIAASAINGGGVGENRAGGRIGRATAKNVLGYRHF